MRAVGNHIPREQRIDTQYASKCGNCGHFQHEHEPEYRCGYEGCDVIGCDTCMQECGFYSDCKGRYCYSHMIRYDDEVCCLYCTAKTISDEAIEKAEQAERTAA